MPLLVLQRGHVPRTTGATGTAGEQAMAISVSQHVARLVRPGWAVRLIDADEPDNRYRGDAFVAVHGDGSTNSTANGASVGYRNPEGNALAQVWKDAYAKAFPGTFRKDNYTTALAGYYGVRRAVGVGNKRACVIEVGFMTNPAERAWIDKNHAAIAESIWTAVAGEKEDDPVYQWIDVFGSSFYKPQMESRAKALGIKLVVRAGDANRAIFSVHTSKEKGDAFTDYAGSLGITDIRRYPGRNDNSVRRLNSPTEVTL